MEHWVDGRRADADVILARWEARDPQVRHLMVGEAGWDRVRPILEDDRLSGVEGLRIESVRIETAKRFQELLATPLVAGASELQLAALGLQGPALGRLGKLKGSPGLRSLTIGWGEFDKPLDERALRSLLKPPAKALAQLEALALVDWKPLNDRLVGADPVVGQLRSLRVRVTRPDWLLRWLAEQNSPLQTLDTMVRGSQPLDWTRAYPGDALPELRKLVLGGDPQAALPRLGDAPFYAHVEVLGWRLQRDPTSALAALAALPAGPRRLQLIAPPSGLDVAALAALDGGTLTAGLERVELVDVTLDGGATDALAPSIRSLLD